MKRGFTLLELLIVTVILGILATIVVPQFTDATQETRSTSTRVVLRTLRFQLERYKFEHQDRYPQLSELWVNLIEQSDPDGTLNRRQVRRLPRQAPLQPLHQELHGRRPGRRIHARRLDVRRDERQAGRGGVRRNDRGLHRALSPAESAPESLRECAIVNDSVGFNETTGVFTIP